MATSGALAPTAQPPCAYAARSLRPQFPGQFGPDSGPLFPAIYRRWPGFFVGAGQDFSSVTVAQAAGRDAIKAGDITAAADEAVAADEGTSAQGTG